MPLPRLFFSAWQVSLALISDILPGNHARQTNARGLCGCPTNGKPETERTPLLSVEEILWNVRNRQAIPRGLNAELNLRQNFMEG